MLLTNVISRANNLQWMEVWNKIAGLAGDKIWSATIRNLMNPVWRETKREIWDKATLNQKEK